MKKKWILGALIGIPLMGLLIGKQYETQLDFEEWMSFSMGFGLPIYLLCLGYVLRKRLPTAPKVEELV
ncbi:MAG: hypothetical protein AAFV25_25105 [Bacteroidota bacterium]